MDLHFKFDKTRLTDLSSSSVRSVSGQNVLIIIIKTRNNKNKSWLCGNSTLNKWFKVRIKYFWEFLPVVVFCFHLLLETSCCHLLVVSSFLLILTPQVTHLHLLQLVLTHSVLVLLHWLHCRDHHWDCRSSQQCYSQNQTTRRRWISPGWRWFHWDTGSSTDDQGPDTRAKLDTDWLYQSRDLVYHHNWTLCQEETHRLDSPHQVHLMVRVCKYDLNPPGIILYLVQTLLTKPEDHWSHGDHDQSEV